MALHLLKLAVGVDSLDQLRRVRAARAAERGGEWVYTRNRPRRANEILAGGSIYWVIRGRIAARQRVIGFAADRDAGGRRFCRIIVDRELVATLPRPCRAFQGWRYLPQEAAPPDQLAAAGTALPAQMLADLRALGLL